MGNTKPLFRTATLGGFQKQDVLDYIEAVGQEHAQWTQAQEKAQEELRSERDALQNERDSLSQELEEIRQQQDHLSAQVDTLSAQLADTEQRLQDAEHALSAARDGQAEAELRAEELENRLKKAEPAARAYECVKDRTAGIELEAHHRAMEVEAAAKEQVKAIKADLEHWFHKVQSSYERLRTDVDATLSHAAGELDAVKQQLDQISGELEHRDRELDAMLQSYQTDVAPQLPQPLPLEGE